jgi:hypothetical protein
LENTAAGTVADSHGIPFSFPGGKPMMKLKYNILLDEEPGNYEQTCVDIGVYECMSV